jgi:hypothetical protein
MTERPIACSISHLAVRGANIPYHHVKGHQMHIILFEAHPFRCCGFANRPLSGKGSPFVI